MLLRQDHVTRLQSSPLIFDVKGTLRTAMCYFVDCVARQTNSRWESTGWLRLSVGVKEEN
jgi:hypothetical protein